MASDVSTALRLELMAAGENTHTWGTIANRNFETLERAIAGYTDIAISGTTTTLTATSFTLEPWHHMGMRFTGVLTANSAVVVPSYDKMYFVENATTGAFTLTVKTAAGTGITVPTGQKALLMCNGTNVVGVVLHAYNTNTATATALQTARAINGVNFDGTAPITITAATPNALTAGTYLTGGTFTGGSAATFAVDATSANTVSKVVARDASGNFSAGTITAALSGNATTATTLQTARTINGTSFNGGSNITITAANPNLLTRGSFLTGSNYDGSAATTWAVDATDLNTASKIVARDASGNFAAGTITAALAGNAATSTKLQTARLINGVPFDGTADVTVTTASASTLTLGTYLTGGSYNGGAPVTVAVDATSTNTVSKIVARDASGNFSAGTITATLSGNASTATSAATLTTARTINGVSFNGSGNITVTATATNALTLGTYLTGTSYNGSTAVTAAVDATTTNTASKIVARDASGNFAAGTITAALSGNATTATTLSAGTDRNKLDAAASRAWTIKTAGYTAVAGDKIAADTSSTAWTLTLPASPTAGTTVDVMDAGGAFATNNLTVARNAQTIMGLGEDMTVSTSNASFALVFSGTTWRLA